MLNFRQSSKSMNAVLTNTVKGGDLVKVGEVFGVAVADGDGESLKTIQTEGVYELPKTSAATVIAQGAKVYVPTGTKTVGTTNTDAFLGYAWKASANGDATVEVAINL